ncbi:MAG TPA: RNA polymerase sigma factor [Sedimentisphaerales bacterium]|nr:RNA polymerase sigma factor [Sedimentisphaerales bacterium]
MFDADENTFSGNNGTEIHRRVGSAAEVFAKYGTQIRAIICFHIKDKSKADDVFQDFFVSLVHNPIPPHLEDMEAYLYRALTNDVIDACRQTSNHQEGIQEYAELHRYDTMQENPQSNFIQVEATQEMFRLIESRLPKCEAAVVLQRYCNGLSITDTAKKTQLDKRSVARYLSLARKKMREFIPQDMGDTQ